MSKDDLKVLDNYRINKKGNLELEFNDNSKLLAVPIKDSDDKINGFSIMGLYKEGLLEAAVIDIDKNHYKKISFWSKGKVTNNELFNYWNLVYNKFSDDISFKYHESDTKLSNTYSEFLRAFYGYGRNARDDLSNKNINIKKYKPRELPERLDF